MLCLVVFENRLDVALSVGEVLGCGLDLMILEVSSVMQGGDQAQLGLGELFQIILCLTPH